MILNILSPSSMFSFTKILRHFIFGYLIISSMAPGRKSLDQVLGNPLSQLTMCFCYAFKGAINQTQPWTDPATQLGTG